MFLAERRPRDPARRPAVFYFSSSPQNGNANDSSAGMHAQCNKFTERKTREATAGEKQPFSV